MKITRLLPVVLTVFLIGGCGNQTTTPSEAPQAGGPQTKAAAVEDAAASDEVTDSPIAEQDDPEEEPIKIVDFGYGQDEWSANAMVIVTTDSEDAVDQFVTASVNFLDQSGNILATEEQVESFSWVGQHLVLPVWFHFDGDSSIEIGSIDPSVSLSDFRGRAPSQEPLPILDASSITATDYDGYIAKFEYNNETDSDITNLRVGVACFNAGGAVIGGESIYPNLAPRGKTVAFDTDVIVSEEPATCKAFLNYG